MRTSVAKSYAKINIALNVVGKKENGYHNLDMIMVPLKLHDTLIFTKLQNRSHNSVTIDNFSIIVERHNSVSEAISLFNKKSGINNFFSVLIHKVIPVKGGFGGGSSNAAATLLLLNKWYKTNYSLEELEEMSLGIGADVPFFIRNVPARCKGIGEKIEPIKIKKDYYVLIVKPEQGCSTKEIFDKSDEYKLKTCNIDNVIKALEDGDDELLANSICNSLYEVAASFVPEIKEIIATLNSLGLSIVQMTGSGSGVFALSTDKKLLKKARRLLEDKYLVELTKIKK